MGHLNVTKLVHSKDKAQYISHLIDDLNALDKMLEDDLIEKTPIRIGAEQEFCLVNDDFLPTNNSLDVLETIGDEHFTTEIGRYNLEINSDPLELKTDCFSQLHKNLLQLLAKARKGAEKHHTKVVLTGILPTLSLKHISESYMTDMPRYKILNEALKASRKQDFSIHIKGVDEINLLHDSVMLEACNTSFQTHLQINPDEFIERFNWAQAIAGPVLSMCTNSPVLFGKELWA
ncbi:MAG: CBS domain-containing protein, partial [Bacteroidia bacterium]|nr:CBS domain-containing protein [Bacteroidia bacterium]